MVELSLLIHHFKRVTTPQTHPRKLFIYRYMSTITNVAFLRGKSDPLVTTNQYLSVPERVIQRNILDSLRNINFDL